MLDATLSRAIAEAYTSASSDVVILHTLELRHPTFLDDDGQPTAVRIVRDHQDLIATLEADAPLNGGEEVTFVAMAFDIELPPIDTTPVPEVTVTIDNASRTLITYLDEATKSLATLASPIAPTSATTPPHRR